MIIELHEMTTTGTEFEISVNIFAISTLRPTGGGGTLLYLGDEHLRVTEPYQQVRDLIKIEAAKLIEQALQGLVKS